MPRNMGHPGCRRHLAVHGTKHSEMVALGGSWLVPRAWLNDPHREGPRAQHGSRCQRHTALQRCSRTAGAMGAFSFSKGAKKSKKSELTPLPCCAVRVGDNSSMLGLKASGGDGSKGSRVLAMALGFWQSPNQLPTPQIPHQVPASSLQQETWLWPVHRLASAPPKRPVCIPCFQPPSASVAIN